MQAARNFSYVILSCAARRRGGGPGCCPRTGGQRSVGSGRTKVPFHSSAAVACQLLGSDRVLEHRLRRCCDVRNSANLENGFLLQVEK